MKFNKRLLLNNHVLVSLCLAYILIALAISVIYAIQVERYVAHELKAKLNFNANVKQQKIEGWLKSYQSDVKFMANLPAVKGYVNATLEGGVDGKYGNSVALYHSFVNDVFASFMEAKPDILKLRIIGLANHGRELVRFNQLHGQITQVAESDLQNKADREYFTAIYRLKNKQLYVSDIDLNQDNGKITKPLLPTIRVGTPLYGDNGQLFGMLVINYSAEFIFKDIAKEAFGNNQIRTLLLNSKGDYLLHPDPARAFGFELGKRYVWTDDFKVSAGNLLKTLQSATAFPQDEKFFFVARDTLLDRTDASRKLTVISLLPTSISAQQSRAAGFYAFATLFFLGLLIAFVFYRAKTNAYIKSEQLKHQSKLEAETQAKQMIEYSTYGKALINAKGLIEVVNLQFEHIFGYKRQEIIGEPLEAFIPTRLHRQYIDHSRQLLAQTQPAQAAANINLFAVNKNGREFPVEIGLARINTGSAIKILVSIVDMTAINAREEALRKTARDLERTGFLAHVGGVEVELATGLVSMSREACAIHGYTEVRQRPLDEVILLYDSESQQVITETIDKAIQFGQDWDVELKLTKVSGQKVWVRTQGVVEYQNGVPTHLVGAIHEITNLKNSMEELNYRNKELNNFAYVASHDLKSPLRGLDQIATWLEEDLTESMAEQTKVYLRLMRSRIRRMEQLLTDLLAYARAGSVYGESERVDVALLVQDVFNLCCFENNFDLKLEGDFPEFVTAKTPLETIFRNLISNAIKHHDGERGEITVSLKTTDQFYQFSVADNGPGIPTEYIDRAFDMFQTLRPRDEIEGSGMGLAIVKKTLESLGGNIQIEANEPRGVVFSFNWPKKF